MKYAEGVTPAPEDQADPQFFEELAKPGVFIMSKESIREMVEWFGAVAEHLDEVVIGAKTKQGAYTILISDGMSKDTICGIAKMLQEESKK